nr:poly-gamma-glutamate hydrolase family protein [Streptomyces taklimakanensis]
MADVYSSYADLAAHETEGVAYERRQIPVSGSMWASIAIHGGGIEPGSGEVARAVAAGLMNHYEFAGILPSDNYRLHVTSTNFDEPIAEGIVAASERTLSFHGYTGDGTPVTALGGLDTPRIEAIRASLTAAGFTVIDAPPEIAGVNPNNIANRNRISAGVQLELSRPQRAAFFPGGDLSRSMRDSGQRTDLFYRYVEAIRQAMLNYTPSPGPGGGEEDGCAVEYAARIVDRDGAVVTDATYLTEVEWNRILNDTSTGRVVINPDGDCCEQMGEVRSWRHQLHIYRNGTFVWGGPILSVEWSHGQVEVFAADLSAWLSRRVPHDTIRFTDLDLTQIAAWLIADGFAPDDPGHEVQIVGEAGVTGGREYRRHIGQTFDHLLDLADTGIDLTVVGNKFVILPEDWSQTVGALTDADMPDGVMVAEDGAALGTRWIVVGGQDGDLIGTAGGTDPYYGLLERYVEQSSIQTLNSANAAARAKLRAAMPVPVFIDTQEVTLNPDADVDIPTLTPGWCLDVASVATCRDITQRLKIVGVRALVQSSGAVPGQEQVQVQVAALGSGR